MQNPQLNKNISHCIFSCCYFKISYCFFTQISSKYKIIFTRKLISNVIPIKFIYQYYLFRLQNANGIEGSCATMKNSKTQLPRHFSSSSSRASQFLLRSPTKFLFNFQYQRAENKSRFDHGVIAHHVHRYVSRSLKTRKSVKCGTCLWFASLCLKIEIRNIISF